MSGTKELVHAELQNFAEFIIQRLVGTNGRLRSAVVVAIGRRRGTADVIGHHSIAIESAQYSRVMLIKTHNSIVCIVISAKRLFICRDCLLSSFMFNVRSSES